MIRTKTRYIRRRWRKPKFENWNTKANHLFYEQNELCAISGEPLDYQVGKIDIHHVLPRKRENLRRFPLYTDCVWNLLLGYNGAHNNEAKPETKKRPLWQIEKLEGILRTYPGIEYRMSAERALEEYGGA